MIPGMERRITEHYLCTSDVLTTASDHSNRSVQEIPLLKGSFGHTSTHTRSNPSVVPNDSSEESLYGMDRAMVMSDSVNSAIGLTRSSSNYDAYSSSHHTTTIPVTAEITCPSPPPPPVGVPLMTGQPPRSSMTSLGVTSPTVTMSRENLLRHSHHQHLTDNTSNQHFSPTENGMDNQREARNTSQVR
jgi:hypothetical protein